MISRIEYSLWYKKLALWVETSMDLYWRWQCGSAHRNISKAMENEDSKALLHLWLRASVGRGADKQQRESHFCLGISE